MSIEEGFVFVAVLKEAERKGVRSDGEVQFRRYDTAALKQTVNHDMEIETQHQHLNAPIRIRVLPTVLRYNTAALERAANHFRHVFHSPESRQSVGRHARAEAGAEKKGGESRWLQKRSRAQRHEKKKQGPARKEKKRNWSALSIKRKKIIRDTHRLANFVGGRPHLNKREGATPLGLRAPSLQCHSSASDALPTGAPSFRRNRIADSRTRHGLSCKWPTSSHAGQTLS